MTGEAVEVDLRVARLPSRILSAVIDLVVQFTLLFVGILLVTELAADSSESGSDAASLVLLLAVLVGYPVVLEWLWRGKTIGKAAMGQRVVRDDGGPIRLRQAAVRGVVGFFERYMLFGIVPIVASLLSRRGQRIGDMLAGTVVVTERGARHVDRVAMMPPPLAGWAAAADLSRLPDDLALSARQFLARAGELHPAARDELGDRLVSAIAGVVSPPPPPGTPGWAYLAAVLAERRRREELRLAARAGVHAGQKATTRAHGYGPGFPQTTVRMDPPPGSPEHFRSGPPPGSPPPAAPPPEPGPGGFVLPS